jgi:catechol 2,3-dioxygenase-like lactoylglutathione lyase family enzyme
MSNLNNVFNQYDAGKLTRRQLVQAILLLAAGQAEAQTSSALQGATINHVSILVSDLNRSVDFYAQVFGARIRSQLPEQVQLALTNRACHLTLNLSRERVGAIDHVALGVEGFAAESAITAVNRLKPDAKIERDPAGFYIYDPDGIRVQVVSTDQ